MRAIALLLSRYLFLSWARHKKQRGGTAIGILLPVCGVSVGVFAFFVVLGVMGGFVNNIKKSLVHSQPHIEIVPLQTDALIPANPKLIDTIKSLHPDIIDVSAYQRGDAIIQYFDKGMLVTIEGNDPPPKDVLTQKHPSNRTDHSTLFSTALVGKSLMEEFSLDIGDTLTLVSPFSTSGPFGLAPLQLPVVVAGSFESGNVLRDTKKILVSLDTANLFLDTAGTWQGLQISLRDPFLADEVALKIKDPLNAQKLQSRTWLDANRAFLKALKLEHDGMSVVLGMVILVGCFSICISLLLSVRRKATEMGILRSLGLRKKDLCFIYLSQGFFIGVAGTLLGACLGLLCLYLVHHYRIPFITSSYSSQPLPILLKTTDMVLVCGGSILMAMVAAVWPAWEVRSLNVVEVISTRK